MRGIGKYFKTLSFEKRDMFIKRSGTLLEKRATAKHRIELYSVNTLFVELFYDAKTTNITSIEPINQEDLEKHYLRKINLRF